MASGVIERTIKTKEEMLTANSYGSIYPSIPTDRILQIRSADATGNLIILPIYNDEIKVYEIPSLNPYVGSITVHYTYY